MDAGQLRRQIVAPALRSVGLWSQEAENLVMGTAAVESDLQYVRQHGGPALGLFQMEPETHDDIWDNYLKYRPNRETMLLSVIDAGQRPLPSRMVWDLRYATLMCRLHYRRVQPPLPEADDAWALGAYWKEHYNTPKGRGTVEKFVEKYRLVAMGE